MSKKIIWIIIILLVVVLLYVFGFQGKRETLLSSVVFNNTQNNLDQVEIINYSQHNSFYIHGIIMGVLGENDLKEYLEETYINGVAVNFNTYLYGGEMGEYLLHNPIRVKDDSVDSLTFVFNDAFKEKFAGRNLTISKLIYNKEAGSSKKLREYDVNLDMPIKVLEVEKP